jgi:hypothetical protein
MDKQELLEQNTAIRASMADASTLLDRAYGPSGERLERRIARLIQTEQRLRAACDAYIRADKTSNAAEYVRRMSDAKQLIYTAVSLPSEAE